MPTYAAYGSNLDVHQMAQRAPHSPQRGTGWLSGWRLTFAGIHTPSGGALATVVEDNDPEHQVFVALYDLSSEDERQLDAWEGVALGSFRKVTVRVNTLQGEEKATIYVVDDYEGGLPTARYLGGIAQAAWAAGAPPDYVMDLRTRPCSST